MAIIGVPMLLGPILGPILGGWLVDDFSWRWIFFINLPIGIVALLRVAAHPATRTSRRPAERFDVLGLALLSPGLALADLRARAVRFARRLRARRGLGPDARRLRADHRLRVPRAAHARTR